MKSVLHYSVKTLILLISIIILPSLALAQWSKPVNISPGSVSAILNESMGSCISVSGDTVHVVWADRFSTTKGAIYYTRSINTGLTWSTPIALTDINANAFNPTIAVNGSNIHLAWRDINNSNNHRTSMYKRSLNGGNTWGSNIVIDTVVADWPAIAVSGNKVYIANDIITSSSPYNTDIFFLRSTDNGATWSKHKQIVFSVGRSEDEAITAQGADVYMSWNDNRTGKMQIYYKHSPNYGTTWDTEVVVIPPNDYGTMVNANGANIDIPCAGATSGNYQIYFVQSANNGTTWGTPKNLTNDPTSTYYYPYMVRDGADIHLTYVKSAVGGQYLHSGNGGASWDNPVFLCFSGITPCVAYTGPVLHIIVPDSGHINYFRNPTGNPSRIKKKSCDMLTFGIKTPSATGVITPVGTTGGTISVIVPYGTSLNNLIALFTVSDSASVYIGSLKQKSGVTANNFSNTLTYKVVAQDTNFSKTYQLNIKYAKNKACDMLTYGIKTPSANAVITPVGTTGGTIAVVLPFGTALNNLTALFTVSDSASVFIGAFKQISGISVNNFSISLSYKVVAQDTNYSKTYQLNISITKNKLSDMLSFSIKTPSANGIITPISTTGGTISVILPYGTPLNNLTAIFSVSDSASVYIGSIKQKSGISNNNFTGIVTYKVVAQDTNFSKTYKLNVSLGKSISCDILAFGIKTPSANGIIIPVSASGGTITVTLPYGTPLNNLTAVFTVSDSATVYIGAVQQQSGFTANNFTNLLYYKVVAQNTGYWKTYEVRIIREKNKLCDMLNYAIQTPTATGIIVPIGSTGGTISVKLPFGTSLNSLTSQFTASDSATVYIGSIKQQSVITSNNFTNKLTYKVVAQDTAYSKSYIVTVSDELNNAAELLSYSIVNPAGLGTIIPNLKGGNVNVTVPSATTLTNLLAQFTVSDSAKAYVKGILQQSSITSNNFTDTLVFIVKAQNNIDSKTYLISVKTNTGAEIINKNERFHIYPNPASKEIQIITDQSIMINSGFKIVDMLGKLVLESSLTAKETKIDISRLANGIYYLQITTNEGSVIGKFVKE